MIKTHLTCGSCLALLLALVAIPVSADAFESNSILTVSKGVDNAVKVIDDAVYYLRTTEDKMELVQLNEAVLSEERVSRLVEITPIIEEPVASFSLQSTISGDDMIATAESYRRNFTWSCVAFLQPEQSFQYIHTYPVCSMTSYFFCRHDPGDYDFPYCLQFHH